MTEPGLNTAAFAFRRRYARLPREEIAQTVLEPGEVEGELRHLLQGSAR